jgi:hypothetical protein
MSGQDALMSGQQVNVKDVADAKHVGMGEVLVGAAVNVASTYGSQKLSLGLGK